MISIKTKTLTLLFFSIAVCSLVISSIAIYITIDNLRNQVNEKLSLLTDKTEKEIALDNSPIESAVNDIANVVNATFDPASATKDPKKYIPTYLDSISLQVKEIVQNTRDTVGGYVYPNVDTYKGIYDVWYILEDKTFIKTDKQESPEMFYPTNESMTWYYAPIINKKPMWTNVYFDEILKENCISYVRPITINGEIIGIAGIDASFEAKKKTVEGIQIYKSGFAFLLDDKQQFVVSPKSKSAIHKSDVENIFQKAKNMNKGTYESDNYYMNFVKMDNSQILVIAAPKKEVMEPVNKITIWIIISTVFIAVTVMLLGYSVSKSIIDPLEKLKEHANRLQNGNLEDPVMVKSDDEVGVLANSFENLRVSIVDQNKKLAEYGQGLEEKVRERTIELERKNVELEKINEMTVGRELKMIQLKSQLKDLEEKANKK